MITPEKMYEVLFDNKEYVNFIFSQHFRKVQPNEKAYSTLFNNEVYFKFLCSLDKSKKSNKNHLLNILNTHEDKFWLKKENYCFLLMLKHIKNNKLTIENAQLIVPLFKINNGFYSYLTYLNDYTKINQNKLYNIAVAFEDEGLKAAVSLIFKHKLI